MLTIPFRSPARARARRLAVAAGLCTMALGLVNAPSATATDEGRVYSFGQAVDHGSPAEPLAAVAGTPTGGGYWTVTPTGVVRAFGDAPDLGYSTAHRGIVDIVATRTGKGFLLALADGGVLAFGDARFLGSMGNKSLAAPVVGMATTPTGAGYWLVASDGGIFSFGDARFLGSMGATKLVAPITAIASTPSGKGYWMAAEDGGVFSFGDAAFRGSLQGGGVTSMAALPRGMGYWLVTSTGDVHRFGDAPELGSLESAAQVVDIAPRPQADGFWLATGSPTAVGAQYHAAAGDPSDADFDRLAGCESSGNWQSRGSYEGGLQFLNSTWRSYGGEEFALHAYDAPRLAQIEIGRRVYRSAGWGAWPSCTRQFGWR